MHSKKRRYLVYADVVLVGLGATAFAALVRHLYLAGLDGLPWDGAFGFRASVFLFATGLALVWFLTRSFSARARDLGRRAW